MYPHHTCTFKWTNIFSRNSRAVILDIKLNIIKYISILIQLNILWKWTSFSRVRLFATPWTVAREIFQARILEQVVVPFSRGSFQPRDRTQVSHITGRFFTSSDTREAQRSACCIGGELNPSQRFARQLCSHYTTNVVNLALFYWIYVWTRQVN